MAFCGSDAEDEVQQEVVGAGGNHFGQGVKKHVNEHGGDAEGGDGFRFWLSNYHQFNGGGML
ncbi:MAG TPA: hypothetical protein EYP10_14385 [Armatimonadetes bacterium]|nr:hypothetical protein [Armatimonadota bacterium]